MKKHFFKASYLVAISCIIVLSSFGSCEKEEEPTPAPGKEALVTEEPAPTPEPGQEVTQKLEPACKMIKQHHLTSPSYYTLYEYDGKGSLIKSTDYNSKQEEVYWITYEFNSAGQVSKKTYKAKNEGSETTPWSIYEYNISYNKTTGKVSDLVLISNTEISRQEITFEYDSNGNRVKSTTNEIRNGFKNTYVWIYEFKDGNMVKSIFEPGTRAELINSNEYYLDQENKLSDYEQMYEVTSKPTPNKNMLKKATFTYTETGIVNGVEEYSYEYNQKGFPIKMNKNFRGVYTSSTDQFTYEYACQ